MQASERHRPESPSSSYRGRWFVVAALILAAALFWYAFHPSRQDPWNNQAIQAKFADLVIQRPQTDPPTADSDAEKLQADVHVVLRYVLTNHSGKPYRMPPPSHGALMKNLSRLGLQEVDSVVWESPVIPAGKTASVQFDLTLSPESEDLSGDELQAHQNLVAFCNRRLKEIRGLVFFDYSHRYAIDLPRGWS